MFNGLEEASPLRYIVYTAVIKLATQSDVLQLVNPKLEEIRNWLVQWDVGTAKVQTLLRVLYDALNQCKQRLACSSASSVECAFNLIVIIVTSVPPTTWGHPIDTT